MRGLVLGFDKTLGTGLLRGDDGKRYVFAVDDWLSRPRPKPGQLVDFELHKGMALEIFLVKNTSIYDATPLLESVQQLAQHLAARSRQVKLSSRLIVPLAILAAFFLPMFVSGQAAYSGYNLIGYLRDIVGSTGTLSSLGSSDTRSVIEAGRGSFYVYSLVYLLPFLAAYVLLGLGASAKKRALHLALCWSALLLPLLMPLVVRGVFALLAPQATESLQDSVVKSLNLALPEAYLTYGPGMIVLFSVGLLGLMYELRRPKKKAVTEKAAVQEKKTAPLKASQLQPQRPQAPAPQPAQARPVQQPAPQQPVAQSAPPSPQARPNAPAQRPLPKRPEATPQQPQRPAPQRPMAQKTEAPKVEVSPDEDDISAILEQIKREEAGQ